MIVIINCKSINDAIDCIRLAAKVLQENCILIFQPVYNVIIKGVLLVLFLIVIAFSMTPYGLATKAVDLSSVNTILSTTGIGSMPNTNIYGVDRSFDVFNAVTTGGYDLLIYIWTEIFMM